MQIILNAHETDDSNYYSQFYMATFPFSRQHDTKTLMHIYLITVSINRMLISQLKIFLGVKFMFPPQFHIAFISYFYAVVIRIIMFQTHDVPAMRSLLLFQ